MQEHGRLVADDVAAQDFVVRRDEYFAKAVLFFHRAAFGGVHEGDRRGNVGRAALL